MLSQQCLGLHLLPITNWLHMQILPFWPTAASGENRTENFSLSGHQITVPDPFSLLTYTGRGDPTCPQPDLSALGNTPVTGQADHGAIIGITHQLLVHVHYGLCLYNFTDSPIRNSSRCPISSSLSLPRCAQCCRGRQS